MTRQQPPSTYRQDLLWLALLCLVLLVTTTVPYLIHAHLTPPGQRFTWAAGNVFDVNSYYMWMRQAAQGKLLWTDLMTADPHAPFFTSSFWLALGLVCRTGLAPELVFHLARGVFTVAFVLALWALLGQLLEQRAERWAAMWLITTGGGFMLLTFAVDSAFLHQTWGPGTNGWQVTELLAWPSLCLYPHFAAALALMTCVFYLWLAALRRPRGWLGLALLAGLLHAVVGSFHLYDVVTISAVLIAHWFALRRTGQAPPQASRALLLILLPGVLAAGAIAELIGRSPIGQAWGKENVLLSVSPLCYALALGLPLLFALARPQRLVQWRGQSLAALFAPVWLLANVLIIYTDGFIPFERRLVLGIQIPLVVLAVQWFGSAGLPRVRGWLSRRGNLSASAVVWLPWVLLVLVTWPDTLARIPYHSFLTGTLGGYVSQDLLSVCHYLEAQPPGPGVLCDYEVGNWIPRYSGQAVYVGHKQLTPDWIGREREVALFFLAEADDPLRAALLSRARCGYVLASGPERAALAPSLASGLLQPVVTTPSLTLYRVEAGPESRALATRSRFPQDVLNLARASAP
jgi:hypothetical protein